MVKRAATITSPTVPLKIKFTAWGSGKTMYRVHDAIYGVDQFNSSPKGNARFSPIPAASSSQSAIGEIKLLTTQIPGWALSSLHTLRKPSNFRLRARLDVCLPLPAKRQVEQSSAPPFTDPAIPFDSMTL